MSNDAMLKRAKELVVNYFNFYVGQKMGYDKTDRGIMGLEKNVEPEDFVEYISDGYECFVGDPLLLAEKDPVLYNYFVRRGIR